MRSCIPRTVPIPSPNCSTSCRRRAWPSAVGSGKRPTRLHCGVIARIPAGRPDGSSFPDRSSTPPIELFRGTMLRHSLTAYQTMAPTLRRDQFCQRRLACLRAHSNVGHHLCSRSAAAGAAAVLINQTHTYRDLFFPSGHGKKTCSTRLMGSAASARSWKQRRHPRTEKRPRSPRAFFERLWWHDQVVFDSSRTRTRSTVERGSGSP